MQLVWFIDFFCGRGAMNIAGLGLERADQLIEAGLLKDIADIFLLGVEKLVPLERWNEKSAQNLVAAIEDAKKNATLTRLLTALGIPHVRRRWRRTLVAAALPEARRCSLARRAAPDALVEDLLEIDGIGEVIARAVAGFFADPESRRVVDKLRCARRRSRASPRSPAARWQGTFVVTGTLVAAARGGHPAHRAGGRQGRRQRVEEDELPRRRRRRRARPRSTPRRSTA